MGYIGVQFSWQNVGLQNRMSWVQVLLPLFITWSLSSAGRAPALQAGGHRFEPYSDHLYGGIAQLARAHGSYPWCRGFKSLFRYFIKKTEALSFRCFPFFIVQKSGSLLSLTMEQSKMELKRKAHLEKCASGILIKCYQVVDYIYNRPLASCQSMRRVYRLVVNFNTQ